MQRYTVIALLALIASGCRTGIELTPDMLQENMVQGHGKQAQYAGGPGRMNALEGALRPPLELAWTTSLSGPSGSRNAAALGATLFVPTLLEGVDVLSSRTGVETGWITTDGAVLGTPAVTDSLLFVPVTGGAEALVAIDIHTASVRWRASGEPVENPVLALNGNIVTTGMFGTVTCYGTADTTALWRIKLPDPVVCAASGWDSTVYIGCTNGDVYALALSSGKERWRFPSGAAIHASPVTDGTHVYMVNRAGRFFALKAADSAIIWEEALDVPLFLAPALDEGLLVLAAMDGNIRAFHPAGGELLWTVDLETLPAATPLITSEYVAIATMNGRIVILSRQSGDIVWSETLQGRIRTSLVLSDGVLCVITDDGEIYGYVPQRR